MGRPERRLAAVALSRSFVEVLRLAERRPQLVDVVTQCVEFALQELAQRDDLRMSGPITMDVRLTECAVEDVGLEERVGAGLRPEVSSCTSRPKVRLSICGRV